jgi:hypothetical protein
MVDTGVAALVKRLAVQVAAQLLREAVPYAIGEEGYTAKAAYATVNVAERAVLDWLGRSGNNRPSDSQIKNRLKANMGVVYLVRGKDQGRLAWHYVLVDQDKLSAFLRQLATRSMDVSRYGRILDSGWGQNPPPSNTRAIERAYS